MLYPAFGFPSISEMWPILIVVLLLFGAKKLPELARSMGGSITQFKKGLKEGELTDDPPEKLAEPKDAPKDAAGAAPSTPEKREETEEPHSA